MAHLHRHSVQGLPTSTSIVDSTNQDLHWHSIGNDITTSDAFGVGHTHRWRGVLTSAQIDDVSELEQPGNG